MFDVRNKTAGIAAGNNGFLFGAQILSTVTTSFTGFSFLNPTNSTVTSTPSGGNCGFSFPSSTPAFSSFPFGAPKKTATTTGGGFSFGTLIPAVGNSAFKIGTSTLTSPSVVNSPNVGITTSQTSANGFSFGNPINSSTTSIPSGGNSGFPFASSTTAFSTSPFGAPKTAASATIGGFSFGTSTPAVGSTAYKIGTSNLAAPSTVNSPLLHNVDSTTSQATANVFSVGNQTYSTNANTTTGQNSGFTFASSTPAFSSFPFGPPKTTASTGDSFSYGTLAPAVGNTAFNMGTCTLVTPSVVNSPSPHNVGITASQTTANAFASSAATGSFTVASNILPSTIQSSEGNSAGILQRLLVGQPAKIPGFPLSAPSTLTPTTMPTALGGFKAPSTFALSTITTASTAFGAPSSLATTTITTASPGFGAPSTSATTTITTASTGFAAPSLLPTPAFAGIKSSISARSAPFMTTASTSFPSSGSSAFTFGAVTTIVPTTLTSLSATTLVVMTTTTTITQASAAPTTINFSQLQDKINKWKIELEEQERVFLNQATQVNAWDRVLISNGEKITILNETVDRIKLDQQLLDHELDFILSQQRELKELLITLEKSVESTPGISVQKHADLEREFTYHLAENIDAQVKRMAEDIKEIIEHLNTVNKKYDDNGPMQQIAKILNAHMDALQWVDQSTAALQHKMDDTSKLYEIQRRDQEKSFRIGYC